MRRYSFVLAALLAPAAVAAPESKMLLRQNWAIQSSADVPESGAALSVAGFRPPRAWYPATLPTTVFSALVAAHVYPDPYFGTNLRSVPGVSYPIGFNFSNAPMPADSPFRKPWWFRTEFKLPAEYRGKTLWLRFRRHQLPRQRLAERQADRRFRQTRRRLAPLRIRRHRRGQARRRPTRSPSRSSRPSPAISPSPSSIGTRMPPDKGMGLWRDVSITATGPGRHTLSRGDHAPRRRARQLSVRAELINASAQPVEGVLKGKIEKMEFSQPVKLAAHETKVVHFAPLKVANPRLWWPAQVGPQNLYPLDLASRPAARSATRATPIRHPRSHQRTRRQGPSPVPHQRQEHPDPRRRLHLRHAAALFARTAGGRTALRPRHEPQRRALRRQAGGRSFPGTVRPHGHPGAGRLVLLRSLGEVGAVGRGRRGRRRRVPARSAAPPGAPPVRVRLAVRQRQSAAAEDRADCIST